MRVAWLFEYPTLNGGEWSLLSTLNGLCKQGIEPLALAPAEGPLAAELLRLGVEHLPLNEAAGGDRSPDTRRQFLYAQLKSLRPALLHANSLSMGRLSGPVAREAGVPSVAHLRDIVGLSRAAVADLNRHSRILAVSRATLGFHLRQGVSGDRSHVCYNGVDLEKFRPRLATGWLHRRLGLSADAVLAVTIGQLVMRKGHDVLVRSAARLKQRVPTLHWLVVGERYSTKTEALEYEAGIHAAIQAEGLSDRFHFFGSMDNIHEVLPESTLLVHPARQEPLGRVLLEAAAAGLPCVASDVGGTREIFPEATMARLVAPNDDLALSTAIAELIESPVERHNMSRAARRRCEERFDVQRAAAMLAGHYRAVVHDASIVVT
jgi:glycosyltransferase involved in cell wall biosynthesis